MILADKIIKLRKKNGWSQEELAEKMNVSRQAVSKWESAQTVPDLGRILQLGELFGVTTDYLLKDDIEDEQFTDSKMDSKIRRVTLAQANEYLEQRKTASLYIAIATFLCILSPIALILLTVASQTATFVIPENIATVVGLIALFIIVTIAVAMYIFCGFKNSPYEFLETENFETEYGVKGMLHEKQKSYRNTYIKTNIIATCLCVLSPIPLFIGAFTNNEFTVVATLAITMIIVGMGVMLFIITGVRWASMQKLLKEGEFTANGKKKNKIKESIETIYWLLVLAIYLGWSFISFDWHITWIIWPIAAVLSAIITAICNLLIDKSDD